MKTNYYHSLTIVGGSGFIGKSIIDSFNNKLLQKHRINKLNIICRKKFKIKEKLNLKKIKIFYKDVGKTKKIPKSDYYIYAAESTNISDYKKNNITKTHLKSIKNFIKLVSHYNNAKVLYISSGSVNNFKSKKISNGYKNLYTKLKILSEKEIKKLKKYNIKTSIARCYTFIGRHLPLNKHYAVGNFLYDAKYKSKITLKKRMKVIRSYMYADDMVEWLISIIKNSKKKTIVYNVGSDETIELYKLAEKIAKLFKNKVKITCQTYDTKKVDKYVPIIRKTKNDLKIKILYNLNKSLKKSLKFF